MRADAGSLFEPLPEATPEPDRRVRQLLLAAVSKFGPLPGPGPEQGLSDFYTDCVTVTVIAGVAVTVTAGVAVTALAGVTGYVERA